MKDVKAHTSNQLLKPKPAWKDVRRRPLGPPRLGADFCKRQTEVTKAGAKHEIENHGRSIRYVETMEFRSFRGEVLCIF